MQLKSSFWKKAALVSVAALVLSGCSSAPTEDPNIGEPDGSTSSGEDGRAVVAIFNSNFRQFFYDAYLADLEEEGIVSVVDAPVNYAKLQTQVESGNVSWNVVASDPWWAFANCGTLLAETTVKVDDLDEKFQHDECTVPGTTFAELVAYDADLYSETPSSWKDFFDTDKFPGERGIWGSYAASGLLEGALMADGVAPEDLYPLDLDRAFNKLDELRPHMVFFETLAQSVEMMQSKSIAMVNTSNNSGYLQADAGGSFQPIWNEALLGYDTYVMPMGSNTKIGERILRAIISPEGQAAMAEHTVFGPTNKGAKPQLDELRSVWSPGNPDNEDQTVMLDQMYWSEHYADITARWTDWVAG